jgi:hypothetical protein
MLGLMLVQAQARLAVGVPTFGLTAVHQADKGGVQLSSMLQLACQCYDAQYSASMPSSNQKTGHVLNNTFFYPSSFCNQVMTERRRW